MQNELRSYNNPTPHTVAQSCMDSLHHAVGKRLEYATQYDKYQSLCYALRDVMLDRWHATHAKYVKTNQKKVYYLSLEFLIGRALQNVVDNLGAEQLISEGVKYLGTELEELYELGKDAGLGNGGLGRLAACFLDSMATMDIAGIGFGIRYHYGMFNQDIVDGYQVEKPDNWLLEGYPWEILRYDKAVKVHFYGKTTASFDENMKYSVKLVDTEDVLAVPYYTFVPGYGTTTVNSLILWAARPTSDFNLNYFNEGDYFKAVEKKDEWELISKVLYPNDNFEAGKELRLKQEYFFVSASLQTIIKKYLSQNDSLDNLNEKIAIQLNDTHPAVSIAEMMRLLVDEYGMNWDIAWNLTTKIFAYTNHTLMPEALEKWSVSLFSILLPRVLEIIYEINRRFVDKLKNEYHFEDSLIRDMSIIEEGEEKMVRMSYLAIVGSHSVNGVAKLHSKLLAENLFVNFYKIWPEKFNNKTNGITQRRWLDQSNKGLSNLITKTIGDSWKKDLFQLKKLEPLVKDKNFISNWREVKLQNKKNLSNYLASEYNFKVDPNTMFDMQVKRIHEYKRQLLNVMGVVHRYIVLKEHPKTDLAPRTVMIGGKAAPGYFMAKLIIKLINDVGNKINQDPNTSDKLKLFFLPNYRVSFAEKIFPASELSQQISTAGTEASGTGNMKFSLNGALTIGTLDGANIEIMDAVGRENFFLFGMTEEEVSALKSNGYHPYDFYISNPAIKRVIDLIGGGFFSNGDHTRYKPIIDSLLGNDNYMLLADFDNYIIANEEVDQVYKKDDIWTRKSVINVANMGYFSSDRTISEYASEIWGLK